MSPEEIVHILKCQARSAYFDARWVKAVQDLSGAPDDEVQALLEEKLAEERRLSFPLKKKRNG